MNIWVLLLNKIILHFSTFSIWTILLFIATLLGTKQFIHFFLEYILFIHLLAPFFFKKFSCNFYNPGLWTSYVITTYHYFLIFICITHFYFSFFIFDTYLFHSVCFFIVFLELFLCCHNYCFVISSFLWHRQHPAYLLPAPS